MPDLRQEAEQLGPQLSAWRRSFHRHPELAFEEHRTAAFVASQLTELGLEVRTGVGKTGVVGLLEGSQPGKTVLVRFDMDALPVQEANETEYASQVAGKMHACGHDGHTAIGLGLATLLARHRDELPGRVKFVFQPAEEIGRGARAMIDDGALEDPVPDVAFGLHVSNSLPLGMVVVQPGPLMAAAAQFRLTVSGRGGHGGMPHETVDALVVAAHIVTAAQTIVSRNVDPAQSAVLTFGTFHAGSAFNVVTGQAELTGTIRALSSDAMDLIEERLRALAEGIAGSFGATIDLVVDRVAPAVINDPAATEIVRGAAIAVMGAEHVITAPPVMVSEDMSEFLNRVPGCFFFVGSMNSERNLDYPHHHPRFDFDEAALPIGLAILAEATTSFLRRS